MLKQLFGHINSVLIGRPPHPSWPDGQHHRHARNDIVMRKALSRYSCPYVRASHRQHCCISVGIKKVLKIDGAPEVNASIDFGYKNKSTLLK